MTSINASMIETSKLKRGPVSRPLAKAVDKKSISDKNRLCRPPRFGRLCHLKYKIAVVSDTLYLSTALPFATKRQRELLD